MKHTTIRFTPEQKAWLLQQAQERNTTESAVIRSLIPSSTTLSPEQERIQDLQFELEELKDRLKALEQWKKKVEQLHQ